MIDARQAIKIVNEYVKKRKLEIIRIREDDDSFIFDLFPIGVSRKEVFVGGFNPIRIFKDSGEISEFPFYEIAEIIEKAKELNIKDYE